MKLSRRALLERWWVLPVAGTLGTFGYMGWYASRVTLGKRAAGAPNFEPGEAVRVASLEKLAEDWAEVSFSYGGRPCVALRVSRPVDGGLSVGKNK